MLTGAAAFLLLLVALLAIPVSLTFQMSLRQEFHGHVELHWAFGLIRVKNSLFQSKAPSSKGNEVVRKMDRVERSSHKRKNIFAVVRQKPFRRRLMRFLNDLWHAVQKKNMNLHVRLGLGDPADTGQLWAIVGPISGTLSNVRDATITIEPDFFDTTFELDSSGGIRLVPLQMIYLTVALLLSPPIWQGIRQIRAMRQ